MPLSPTFRLLVASAAFSLVTAVAEGQPRDTISLAGQWRFELDPQKVGVRERWFDRALADKIRLPGSLPEQDIGDEPSQTTKWMGEIKDQLWYKNPVYASYAAAGNFHFPFWLQPEKYYSGWAWYQNDIEIPKNWRGKRIVLSLERPHWETQIWLDGRKVGANDSLSTPHVYDLGAGVAPGKHQLTIRVDNSLVVDIGVNSHSISDHTQGNWNGIVGQLDLSGTDPIWINDMQVFPNVASRTARARFSINNSTAKNANGTLKLHVESAAVSPEEVSHIERNVSIPVGQSEMEVMIPFGENAKTWDEFSPLLYRLRASLESRTNGTTFHGECDTTFGLREISTAGTQFLINGRKTFFRGTLECAIFPLTGHPPTEVESWKRIIEICKAYGLNMIRFHSWCPPEAAFVAADEAGFYYQVEAGSWASTSTTLGDGKPVDRWVERETDRILKAYGNHPSFVLMTYGNEPAGKGYAEYLDKWVRRQRSKDPRRLYSGASGWPQIEANQFHVTPEPRIQQWDAGLKSRINAEPPETKSDYREYVRERNVPVISHEIGEWCAYPNFDEVAKYTGYLKPKNVDIFRDSLEAHSMGDQAHEFLMASGKLQTLCYKEEIEAALRTPGMGGFQMLDLHDFSGQGAALVGVLDALWGSKGYVTAEEYRRFCNATVPLARFDKRVFTTDETLIAKLEISHFGAAPLKDAVVYWRLINLDGTAIARGELPRRTIPVDNGIANGDVRVPLRDVPTPAQYKFVVGIANTKFENDWDIWVYPSHVDSELLPGVTIVDDLDAMAVAKLRAGGKVLLTIPPYRVRGDKSGKVAVGFSSIFWNSAWTGRLPPQTLGILCDPKLPLFANFPTEFHSNWQWWYMVNRSGAMILDGLPPALRPTIQVIDDWVTNRRLGMLFEAKVGPGNLAVCCIDLTRELESDPVRRQFRSALLKYVGSKQFEPHVDLTIEQLRSIMLPRSRMHNLGAVAVETDSDEIGNSGYQAIDGDPKTIWHTQWRGKPQSCPHGLQVEFTAPIRIRGFTLLPRQDGLRNGWIKNYEFFVSCDKGDWGQPIARGGFTSDKSLKSVLFPKPIEGRFVRLVATSGFDSTPYTSIAEFEVLEADGQKPP